MRAVTDTGCICVRANQLYHIWYLESRAGANYKAYYTLILVQGPIIRLEYSIRLSAVLWVDICSPQCGINWGMHIRFKASVTPKIFVELLFLGTRNWICVEFRSRWKMSMINWVDTMSAMITTIKLKLRILRERGTWLAEKITTWSCTHSNTLYKLFITLQRDLRSK